MGSIGSAFAGALGEIGSQLEKERERKRALDDYARQTELKAWSDLLARPDMVPEARTAFLGRYFDTLAAMTGNKAARKHLQPAQEFLTTVMGKVFPGGESRPEVPAQTLPGAGEPGSGVEKVTRIEIPPLPGIQERVGPFYSPEEMAGRESRFKAQQSAEEAAAELPFFRMKQDILNRNAIQLEEARQAGRSVIQRGVPDPRPGASEWDYVDIVQRGDGSQEISQGKRPPAIERAFQTASAVAAQRGIPMEQAWSQVWAQPFKAGEQQAAARDELLKSAPLRRQAAQQQIAASGQQMTERGMRISATRAKQLADVLISQVQAPAGTPPEKRLEWAISNLDDPRGFYAKHPELGKADVAQAVRAELVARQNKPVAGKKAGSLNLKNRTPGGAPAATGGPSGAPAIGSTVMYQGKPHRVLSIGNDGYANLEPISQ